MKKIIHIVVAIILATISPLVNIKPDIIALLYIILGIVFSIGMCLTITINNIGIKNKTIKNKIKYNIKNIRNKFIMYFTFTSIIYLIIIFINFKDYFINWVLLFDLLFSIIYFIVNIKLIAHFKEDIENKINEEI